VTERSEQPSVRPPSAGPLPVVRRLKTVAQQQVRSLACKLAPAPWSPSRGPGAATCPLRGRRAAIMAGAGEECRRDRDGSHR